MKKIQSSEWKKRIIEHPLPSDEYQVLQHVERMVIVRRFIQADSLAMTKTFQLNKKWYGATL